MKYSGTQSASTGLRILKYATCQANKPELPDCDNGSKYLLVRHQDVWVYVTHKLYWCLRLGSVQMVHAVRRRLVFKLSDMRTAIMDVS
jgi:hypothetical protein